MLVCNVSLRPPRAAIAADIAEAGDATDATATGFVVFATLVDDPAAVRDIVDAYLGEIMLEAASASDAITAGSAYAGAVDEAATADDVVTGTVSAPVSYATFDGSDTSAGITLTNGNLTARANTSSSMELGTRSTAVKTAGKFYFEMTFHAIRVISCVGILRSTGTFSQLAVGTDSTIVRSDGNILTNNTGAGVGPGVGGFAASDVACFAIDLTARLVWVRRNGGLWNGTVGADPATGTSGYTINGSFSFCPALVLPNYPVTNDGWTANFGATAFAQAVPSGFTAGWTN